MTILNTTFIVADHLMEQFLAWARQAYMPALRDAGIFNAPTMATSIAIQARCHALEEATRWHDETAALLKDDLTARFGQQVLFFTTYMEVLE